MGKETGEESHGGQKPSKNEGKKIHRTHFSVDVKVPLRDEGYDTKYEWVNLGNDKWILVRKKSPF